METTEKTMHPKVQEFIETAKKLQSEELAEALDLEKQKQQAERDNLLISLGLYSEKIIYIDHMEDIENYDNAHFDSIRGQYYTKSKVAYSVSDEEFEEIKKYTLKKEKTEHVENISLDNTAEQFLGILNTLSLILCLIVALILFVVGITEERNLIGLSIGFAILGLMSYACAKVVLNISNNLHQINSKMK